MASEPTKKSVMVVIFACLGSVALLLLMSVACFLYFRCSKTSDKAKVNQVSWVLFPTHGGISETKVSAGNFASSPSPLGCIFTFFEILGATKNFDESLVIRVGGFRKVYR